MLSDQQVGRLNDAADVVLVAVDGTAVHAGLVPGQVDDAGQCGVRVVGPHLPGRELGLDVRGGECRGLAGIDCGVVVVVVVVDPFGPGRGVEDHNVAGLGR